MKDSKRARARAREEAPASFARLAVSNALAAIGQPCELASYGPEWYGWGRLERWCLDAAGRGLGGGDAHTVANQLAARWASSAGARSAEYRPSDLERQPSAYWVGVSAH